MAERLNASVLKTDKDSRPSRVRIPPSPPLSERAEARSDNGGEGLRMRTRRFDKLAKRVWTHAVRLSARELIPPMSSIIAEISDSEYVRQTDRTKIVSAALAREFRAA